MSAYRVSAVPATIGVVLLGTAIYLHVEHSIASGHLTSTDALQPAITLAVAVAGVLSHHRLGSWRLVSGTMFALLALIGSGVVVYSTLSRTAQSRDLQAANALASGRQLADLGDELTRTRTLAEKECRVVGPRCQALQGRVDKLIADMSGLRSVSADPRADAIAKLAVLLGWDGERAKAIVSAIDPAVAPIFCEIACVLMLAAGFPHRRLQRANERKDDASVTAPPPMNQRQLAAAWGVHESTVSRRLRALEAAGAVQRVRSGRAVHCAPSSPQALLPAPPK